MSRNYAVFSRREIMQMLKVMDADRALANAEMSDAIIVEGIAHVATNGDIQLTQPEFTLIATIFQRKSYRGGNSCALNEHL
jgi:hypothetical protein